MSSLLIICCSSFEWIHCYSTADFSIFWLIFNSSKPQLIETAKTAYYVTYWRNTRRPRKLFVRMSKWFLDLELTYWSMEDSNMLCFGIWSLQRMNKKVDRNRRMITFVYLWFAFIVMVTCLNVNTEPNCGYVAVLCKTWANC